MFGHNEVAGQKFFREHPAARAGCLLVTSIFRTVQGEGPHAGTPAAFVRLAKCQLSCNFCDTYFDSGDWLDPGAILGAAVGACPTGVMPDLMVITGGEPTLQGNLGKFIDVVLTEPNSPFSRVQIESNGLIRADVPDRTTVVVSPKRPEKKDGLPLDPMWLRWPPLPLASLLRADCLKFVLSGDPESAYHWVPDWAREWRRQTGREIYVSPMAEYNHTPEQTRALYDARRAPSLAERTAAEKISFWEPGLLDLAKCRRNYEYAALYAIEHGLRFSIQMHLFASLP